MTENTKGWLVTVCGALLVVIIAVFASIRERASLIKLQGEAVTRGYAEYRPDKDGYPKWSWKEERLADLIKGKP